MHKPSGKLSAGGVKMVGAGQTNDRSEPPDETPTLPLRRLMLGAVGVVFGDIATSPLYAFQEAFRSGMIAPNHGNILGLLSLLFWALVLVVSVKYVLFVMRADNQGEGGMVALMALAHSAVREHRAASRAVVFIGLAGAAFFLATASSRRRYPCWLRLKAYDCACPHSTPGYCPLG